VFLTARCEHFVLHSAACSCTSAGRTSAARCAASERAVDRLDERAVEPGASDAAVVRYLVTAVALVV
jgi:hypothetical protein|tara:strand:- start:485 stop:685 length:201 start_codon:yes stop_codon:yes gene_type:complete